MSFKQELMSSAKVGGAAFVGYALNRFVSTMEYSKQILKESPETGAVLVSSGITVSAIKFQSKIKDKQIRIGLIAGSAAASIHLATRIPTIQKALPAGIVTALSGDDDGYEEISGEEAENQINAEVDARIQKAFQEGRIQYIQPSNQLALAGETIQSVYEVGDDLDEEMDGEDVYDLSGVYDL